MADFEKYRIVMSVNDNPLYSEFIIPVIRFYIHYYPGIEIKIIYAHPILPKYLENYKKYIICYDNPHNLPSKYISQHLRYLVPCLWEKDKWNILSDIDLIVLINNFDLMTNCIDPTKFINIGKMNLHEIYQSKMIPFAPSIVRNYVLSLTLNIVTKKDMDDFLLKNFVPMDNPWGYDWFKDQHLLFDYFKNSMVKYKRHDVDRLDREMVHLYFLKQYNYHRIIDLHLPRPYSQYKEQLDQVLLFLIHCRPINDKLICLE